MSEVVSLANDQVKQFQGRSVTSGKALWATRLGEASSSPPITYAVDGRQYVALAAGNVVYSFTLQE